MLITELLNDNAEKYRDEIALAVPLNFRFDAHTILKCLSTAEAGRPDVSLNTTDDAGIYFTSGTTGTPKGVLLTHGNLAAAALTENQHHRQTHADNFLCIPPLYHTGAKMHWLGNFMVGAKAIILKG